MKIKYKRRKKTNKDTILILRAVFLTLKFFFPFFDHKLSETDELGKFKVGNPPKVTNEPITRIISKQLDIKLGPFTQEELDSVF